MSYKLECNEYDILVNLYSLKSLHTKKCVTILSRTLKDTLRHEALIQKLTLKNERCEESVKMSDLFKTFVL